MGMDQALGKAAVKAAAKLAGFQTESALEDYLRAWRWMTGVPPSNAALMLKWSSDTPHVFKSMQAFQAESLDWADGFLVPAEGAANIHVRRTEWYKEYAAMQLPSNEMKFSSMKNNAMADVADVKSWDAQALEERELRQIKDCMVALRANVQDEHADLPPGWVTATQELLGIDQSQRLEMLPRVARADLVRILKEAAEEGRGFIGKSAPKVAINDLQEYVAGVTKPQGKLDQPVLDERALQDWLKAYKAALFLRTREPLNNTDTARATKIVKETVYDKNHVEIYLTYKMLRCEHWGECMEAMRGHWSREYDGINRALSWE
jgi:hypothetical protein